MQVAGLQFDIAWEQPQENFRRVETLARQAVENGARLLVLPEMFATGFSMHLEALSQQAPSIESWVASLAYDLQVHVVAGVADVDATLSAQGASPAGVNLALVYNPDGQKVGSYQKIHPFSYGEEHKHYRGGRQLFSFEAECLRITPYVCYDLRFPEIFRLMAAQTDLMLVIASWPAARRHAWRSLLVARAIENQCFVMGVNRVGEGQGLLYSGDSVLIDPLGERISEVADGPAVVMGEVDAAAVVRVRERFPFLKDRQDTLYQQLASTLAQRG